MFGFQSIVCCLAPCLLFLCAVYQLGKPIRNVSCCFLYPFSGFLWALYFWALPICLTEQKLSLASYGLGTRQHPRPAGSPSGMGNTKTEGDKMAWICITYLLKPFYSAKSLLVHLERQEP